MSECGRRAWERGPERSARCGQLRLTTCARGSGLLSPPPPLLRCTGGAQKGEEEARSVKLSPVIILQKILQFEKFSK